MDISTSVAIIAGLLLLNTIFLVVVLIKAVKAFTEAQKLLETARIQLTPISHDITRMSTQVEGILTSVHKNVDKVGESLDDLRDTARNVKEFEVMVQKRIQEPLLEVADVLNGLIKGLRVFWRTLMSR